MKTILVNAVSAKPGGGLVILNEFLANIPNDNHHKYVVFACMELNVIKKLHNIQLVKLKSLGKIGSLLWNELGVRVWCCKNKVKPDLIVSLQNMGVGYNKNIPQLVYYHQSIPLMDYKWSFFKRRQRSLWYYKNIYPILVKRYIRSNTFFIVQQHFLVELLAWKYEIEMSNIKVFRPTVYIDKTKIKPQKLLGEFKLFYPCAPYPYKNHVEIAHALKYVQDVSDNIAGIKIYLTVSPEQVPELMEQITEYEIIENFVFLGGLDHNDLLNYYHNTDAVIYPSYIECFTLPLLEAISFSKPILACDTAYAREQLKGYNNAYFSKVGDSIAWGENIIKVQTMYPKKVIWEGFNDPSWTDLFKYINMIML